MESVLKGYKFSIILLLVFGSLPIIQEWTIFLKVLGRDNTKYKIVMHICIFCVICCWWTLILGAYTEVVNWHSCTELENSFLKCDLAPTAIFTWGWQQSHFLKCSVPTSTFVCIKQDVQEWETNWNINFMVTLCINSIQHFNIQLMHTTLKNVELLKHFKISKTAHGAVLLILKCFNNSMFFNVVCISWILKCWNWNIFFTVNFLFWCRAVNLNTSFVYRTTLIMSF